MTIFLASPNSQIQANAVIDMPVLLSFASYSNWLDNYQQAFGDILIDSGAFSEFTTGKRVDIEEYADFQQKFKHRAVALAGLDDISGDWRRSISNYEKAGGFPTYHETDPIDLLPDLIEISREQGRNWLGLGLLPGKRAGKEKQIRSVLDQIPDDIHVHGWALRLYSHVERLNSIDSTNWWRDAMRYRRDLPFLTYGEALELVVKRYQREHRIFKKKVSDQLDLF